MANTLHKNLTAAQLHYSKIKISPGVPSATPAYQGESYYNTTSNIFYIATATASPTDWQPVVTGTSVNSQPGTTYTVISSDNGKIIDMTSSSARVVTLPAIPVNGFQVGIFDGSGNAYTNDITIDATGSTSFWDGTATYKIVSDYAGITLTFDEDRNKWISVAENIGGTLVIDSLLDTTTIDNAVDHSKQLQFALSGATTSTKTTIVASQTANRTIQLFDATDTVVGKATTDDLSNKSFTSATVIKSANELRFNNAGNTFYSSIKGGNNSANLPLTLPITAPTAGQALTSSDTSGTLGWSSLASQQSVATAATINALSSSTTTVLMTGSTNTSINGITAGSAGQEITIYNSSTGVITILNENAGASATNRIVTPSALSLSILPSFSLVFIYNNTAQRWVPKSQIAAGNIIGAIPTASNIFPSPGFIGERVWNVGNLFTTGLGTWQEITFVNLSAGYWAISGVESSAYPAGPAGSRSGLHLGTTTSSTSTKPTDAVIGENFVESDYGAFAIPSLYYALTAPTTFYLNLYSTVNLGLATGTITAIRVG